MNQTIKINLNIKKKLESEGLFIAFWLKNTDITDVSFFFLLLLFNPWATPQVPTVDQLKKDSFSPYEKIVLQMSLSLPLTAIS